MPADARGFTLIELVVGIVTLGLSMVLLTTLVFPMATRSTDPVMQVRAAELGQGLLAEILGKAYDDNADFSGGQWRCGETGAPSCSARLGPEEDSRERYNDVDDYHGFTQQALGEAYAGYQLEVSVSCGNIDQLADAACRIAKRIDVIVETPNRDRIPFTAYRYNW